MDPQNTNTAKPTDPPVMPDLSSLMDPMAGQPAPASEIKAEPPPMPAITEPSKEPVPDISSLLQEVKPVPSFDLPPSPIAAIPNTTGPLLPVTPKINAVPLTPVAEPKPVSEPDLSSLMQTLQDVPAPTEPTPSPMDETTKPDLSGLMNPSGQEQTTTQQSTPPPPPPTKKRNSPFRAIAAFIILLLLIGGGAIVFLYTSNSSIIADLRNRAAYPGGAVCDNGVALGGTACKNDGDPVYYVCVGGTKMWSDAQACPSGQTCHGTSCTGGGSGGDSCNAGDHSLPFNGDVRCGSAGGCPEGQGQLCGWDGKWSTTQGQCVRAHACGYVSSNECNTDDECKALKYGDGVTCDTTVHRCVGKTGKYFTGCGSSAGLGTGDKCWNCYSDGKCYNENTSCGTNVNCRTTTTVAPTNGPQPTSPPSNPTATPVVGQCTNIKIYKDSTAVTPSTLQPGDAVTLAVIGTNATKARFRVNGGDFTETTTQNSAGEYTLAFTIPSSGVTQFTVEAEVNVAGVWK
jgi:hypothetical protein